jgi:hypothetical protein
MAGSAQPGPLYDPALDINTRVAVEASKREQFRILSLNIAMGIENGRVEAFKAQGTLGGDDVVADVPPIGSIKRIIDNADSVFKYLNTGH